MHRNRMNPLKMTIAFLVCSTTRLWTTRQSCTIGLMVHAFLSPHRFAPRAHQSALSLASQVDEQTSTSEESELKRKGREKRQKFIGLAKAVDRGQFTPYNPLKNGKFEAKSGLPQKLKEGKLFTVLGIESSCDDTGGECKFRACVVHMSGVHSTGRVLYSWRALPVVNCIRFFLPHMIECRVVVLFL
jgi:hypothetical protein